MGRLKDKESEIEKLINSIMTSDIEINKILTENKRQDILKEVGYNETEAYAKYKKVWKKE